MSSGNATHLNSLNMTILTVGKKLGFPKNFFALLTASTGLFSHFMGSPGSSTGMTGLNALYGAINAIYLSVMKDNFCGAQTTLYCVLDDDLENQVWP